MISLGISDKLREDLVTLIQIGKGRVGKEVHKKTLCLYGSAPVTLCYDINLHFSWLLDSISGFKVLPFEGYLYQ
jgi:hypothetical protein